MSEFNLPPIVSSKTSLQESISLLSRAETDYILAVDKGLLVGWLTAKDVVKLVALGKINEDCNLEAVMTQPYQVLNPEEAEDLPLVWQYFQTYQVLQLPVVSAEGEFLGLVTVQEVLKKQTKYIEALKQQFNNSSLAQTESSYLLKEITSFYPGIIYIYDLERQCIVYNSESMTGFLGYTKEEIRSKGNAILTHTIHAEDIAQIDSCMAEVQLLADGEIKQFEYRAYGVDGDVHWLQNDLRVFRRKPDGKAKLLIGFVQDIGDCKAAEAKLQQKRLDLEAILMVMPDFCLSADKNGICLEFYSAPKQEMFTPIDQMIGKNIIETLPNHLAKEVLTTIQKVLASKEIATIECEIEGPLGLQCYHCKIIPLTDLKVLLIARNITDRKNMEKQLRQSNVELERKVLERTTSLWKTNIKLSRQIQEKHKLAEALNQSEILFRGIFEQAAVGINISNQEGQFLQVNQKFCQITGYSKEELLTMTWMELTPPDFLAISLTNGQKIIETNTTESFEKESICKDGSLVWVNITLSRIEGIIGQGYCELAIIEDISRRKQVEIALRKSENKSQKIVANIPGVIYEYRQDVAGNYSFDYVSDFCQQLYGVPASEIIEGKSIFNANNAEEDERLLQSIIQSAETMQPWNYVGSMIDASGKMKWIEGISHPERQENGEIIWYGILMDVTDRQLAQEQIRTALHEKELLLKEIHHRVKNNLQIIISLLSLQSQYIQDQSINSLFQESQNRVYSMALIHEQLYQSTRLDRVNFADYTNTLISHLEQSYFLRRPIKLKVEIAEVFLSIETAVPCGLIINELVANALKYAFPEDQPDISRLDHPLITVEFRQIDGNRFSLLVKDNGVGISADIDLNNLSTLGLSLVQMLTQQLEGELSLHNQQGAECSILFSELSYDRRV